MIDETIARDIAEDAVELFELRGRVGRVEYAVREAGERFAAMGSARIEPKPDELARAYALALRELRVGRDSKGAELHPDGSRRPMDAELVEDLFGMRPRS